MCEYFLEDFPALSINGEDATSSGIEANCLQMCPCEEMAFREKHGLLHRLELSNIQDWDLYRSSKCAANSRRVKNDNRFSKQFTNKGKAVKQFKRSSAGQNLLKATEIRPSSVLRKTVDYLLVNLPNGSLQSLPETPMLQFGYFYEFVFDRLRSVRQDIVVQRLADQNCFYILEKCIDFYAYSEFTWQYFQSSKSTAELRRLAPYFDAHLNRVHLTECLNLLLRYYDHFEDTLWSLSRPLYEAIFLIYNLEANQSALKRYQLLKQSIYSRDVFKSGIIQAAKKVLIRHLLGNHVKSLQLVREQYRHSPLFCIAFYISSLSSTHLRLLQQTCLAYRSPNTAIPLNTLAVWFCPGHLNLPNCIVYLERLAKYFQIPIEYSQTNYFNFTGDDDVGKGINAKKLLIKEKFPIDQWKVSSDLHPTGWFPIPTNFFQTFYKWDE